MIRKVFVENQGAVSVITMDASPGLNTVDPEFCAQMLAALDEATHSPNTRTVVLQGSRKLFSAGGSLPYIKHTLESPGELLASLIDAFHEVILTIRRIPIPVIASVHGAAAGAGFSLAMACDLIVAADTARFVVGYSKLGTSSDGGLTFQLSRRLGSRRAMEVFLLMESLDAALACEMGLVNRVTNEIDLRRDTLLLAERLAAQEPEAVCAIKGLLNLSTGPGLEEHLQREKHAFLRCAATPEFRERVMNFGGPVNKG
ncbi:enoyl-CoA hydratase/isomerase family protein [Cupriavidus basilensis]|uniref:Enoyl-CoA hydratase n=1 Tax=Cupriavidus basilensis TaxID=68895 RepID=A0A0C4YI68_9BURK|nr:enoyl-CoA hydratase-related protein [Cupriavidus basilensis]AJG22320.1 Enoyl-CoA hydratase [Cupriavidus basilensis]